MTSSVPTKSPALVKIRQYTEQFANAPSDPNVFSHLWVALVMVDLSDLLLEFPDGRIPVNYEHLIALGNHAFRQQQNDEAIEHYARAYSLRPEWPFAGGALAYALSVVGRHAEADLLFQRIAQRYQWPYGNIRLGAEFWNSLQAAQFAPPEFEFLVPQERPLGWRALVAVDSRYFEHFVPTLASSFLRHHGDEAGLHVHLINPTDAAREQARQLSVGSNGLIAVSVETKSLGEDHRASCERIRERRTYYACSRFLLAPQLLRQFHCPLVILDADLVVKQNLTPIVLDSGAWDVGVTRFPGNSQPLWQLYFASFQVFRPTPGGQLYTSLLARYQSYFLSREQWIWPVDQAGLYSLGEFVRGTTGAPNIRVHHFSPEIITAGVYFENRIGSMVHRSPAS